MTIHESIWDGRTSLVPYPEVDWAVTDPNSVYYWPPHVTIDWRLLDNGGGFGILSPFDNWLRRWRRCKRIRCAPVQARLKRRIIDGHREQAKVVGEAAPNCKLQEQDVITIRTLYHSAHLSINKIARRYAVSTPTIAQVVKGDTWKHLPLVPPVDDDSTH